MLKFSFMLALAIVVSACAYHTPPRSSIDDPFVRKLAWFSYLDGNDIRETCNSGAIDRYRLVYNAQYEKQVRSYEVTGDGAGGAYLVARARAGSPNLAEWRLADPMAPWRWQKSETRLTTREFEEFRDLLVASGFGQGASQGKRLHSHDFYWIAAGCTGGSFGFDAWVDAQGDFADIRFKEFLKSRDQAGLAFREAVPVPMQEKLVRGKRKGQNPPEFFILTVSGEGLGGLINAF